MIYRRSNEIFKINNSMIKTLPSSILKYNNGMECCINCCFKGRLTCIKNVTFVGRCLHEITGEFHKFIIYDI